MNGKNKTIVYAWFVVLVSIIVSTHLVESALERPADVEIAAIKSFLFTINSLVLLELE